jgi:hypothetical protein
MDSEGRLGCCSGYTSLPSKMATGVGLNPQFLATRRHMLGYCTKRSARWSLQLLPRLLARGRTHKPGQ